MDMDNSSNNRHDTIFSANITFQHMNLCARIRILYQPDEENKSIKMNTRVIGDLYRWETRFAVVIKRFTQARRKHFFLGHLGRIFIRLSKRCTKTESMNHSCCCCCSPKANSFLPWSNASVFWKTPVVSHPRLHRTLPQIIFGNVVRGAT